MDPTKVSAVLRWPTPSTLKSIRGFLGLTGYYRRFIRDYGKIAAPLTALLRKPQSPPSKQPWLWPTEAARAFEALKKALTSAPLLRMPDFTKEFIIECDASGCGLGAVLMQERQPVAYFSKTLSPRWLAKSAYEKELMALVLAIHHWRPYLLGRRFVVHTDQRSLRQLLAHPLATPAQQNWAAKLLGYDFSIVYKEGRLNKAADALSRRDKALLELSAVSRATWPEWTSVQSSIAADPTLAKIKTELEAGRPSSPHYELVHGTLFYKGRIVVPSQSPWIQKLIAEFHVTPTGGHSGAYRTYRRIAANAGDFDCIFVVIDRLSKYAHFIGLRHPFSARQVADAFTAEVIRLHGIPCSIVSDRDPLFLGSFWKELFRATRTKLKMSSAYHAETDGQTEVLNRCLQTYLRCFSSDRPKQWHKRLPWAEYCYNTSTHSPAGTTPFAVVYGRPPPTIQAFLPGEVKAQAVVDTLRSRDEALELLRHHLQRAQQRMTITANKHRRDVHFSVGDSVYLKFRPHRQSTLFSACNRKLAPRFSGPFRVAARIGESAYRLDLPDLARTHPVFHVSLLKRAIGDEVADQTLPEGLINPEPPFLPESVLDRRVIEREGQQVNQVLLKWEGLDN
ncbi:uncharacterized protein LOC125221113 [Salvia hispanica]|uniref:uncharacterized protein LOC125221113 n=1 Tax=Salvia hispanica TaxID=49212 RepID=UPI002009C9A7|nr:uncharacterized protein LOC125221113 [Salvia hispanica]